MIRTVAMVFVAFALAACSSVGSKGVEERSFERSMSIDQPYDQIWNSAVEWFAIHNIPISKIEKDSGLISSEYGLESDQLVLDCGKPTGNIGLYRARFEGLYGNVNVIVRRADEGSRATISVFGTAHAVLRNGFGKVGENSTKCASTGALEASFFEHLSAS